jgi:hypothetical protein
MWEVDCGACGRQPRVAGLLFKAYGVVTDASG